MRVTIFVLGLVVLGLSIPVFSQQTQSLPTSIFDDHWYATPRPAEHPQPQPPGTATRPSIAVRPQTQPSAPPLAAVPTSAAQQGSWKLINELYKDDITKARTPAQKVELARKLLAVAQDSGNDPVGRFVLLTQARELAIGSGDPATAFMCLDELGKSYQIDYVAMKLVLFEALARSVGKPDDCKTIVDGLNRWMDGRIRADQFDAARKAGDIALVAASRSGDLLEDRTTSHMKEIGEIQAGYGVAKRALAVLEMTPDDPGANLTAGKYYCFMKGDWETGLPMLALGNDVASKTLAAQEIAGISGADAEMSIGDGWWEVGEKSKGLSREQLRQHAAKWYQAAIPQLSGLAKVKVEKRLASLNVADTRAARKPQSNWLVLFKSSDPSIWGKDVDNDKGYAILLTKAPSDVKWLKRAITESRGWLAAE